MNRNQGKNQVQRKKNTQKNRINKRTKTIRQINKKERRTQIRASQRITSAQNHTSQ